MGNENYYPRVTVDLKKLRNNIDQLKARCGEQGVNIVGVIKGCTGIPKCTKVYEEAGCQYIASSRLEQIKDAIDYGVKGPFMLIRVPMLSEVDDAVRFTEISLNSELEVIKALNAAAAKQNKIHKIIIMVDLGDLREGFWDWDEVSEVALMVENDLDNLELAGVGTNLGCYGSITPTVEKMNDLIECAEMIEKKIGRKLEIISGGASTSLARIFEHDMPERINQLRLGEAIVNAKDSRDLFGYDMSFMFQDAFVLEAEVIEVKDKPSHPIGEISFDAFGMKQEYTDRGIRRRALLGLGKVDYAFPDMIYPMEEGIEVLGASSDHTIIDIEDAKRDIRVGDIMKFTLCYATIVYATNSPNVKIFFKEAQMKEFLLEHAAKNPVSFHMPGHKGSEIFRKYGYSDVLDNFVDMDVTEIPGADNLFQTEGIIKDVQDRYAGLYGVERSYLQINGTSGGIIASILATVPPGKKLIMARNCHKSVFNALILGHIEPVYAKPILIEEAGISGPIPPEEIEKLLKENPDGEAVILPSPNYYGICSDIRAIADVVHKAGKVLIVDQAHGAHLKFFHKFGAGEGMAMAAEDCGADIVINSIHKTLASLTQSALLNLNSERVDRYALEDKLQAIESTSPSYILMTFLDINADLLEKHGAEVMKEWKNNIEYFYREAKKIDGLEVMIIKDHMDISKINLDMGALGIDGAELEQLLMKYDIFSELYTGNILMLMTGIGNTRTHMDKTLNALREIAAGRAGAGANLNEDYAIPKPPAPGAMHPIPRDKVFVGLQDAVGAVCAASIIPYPPGIPFLCPGEEITREAVEYIKSLRDADEKVIGVNDRGEVLIGK